MLEGKIGLELEIGKVFYLYSYWGLVCWGVVIEV